MENVVPESAIGGGSANDLDFTMEHQTDREQIVSKKGIKLVPGHIDPNGIKLGE